MRRRYVISYDISDDKRRTRVFELLLGNGDHVQFSVFLADLSQRELIVLRTNLLQLINERDDQILIIDLGKETRSLNASLEVIGRAYQPPTRSMVV
jgi:CRISPR-associated protein Cas2